MVRLRYDRTSDRLLLRYDGLFEVRRTVVVRKRTADNERTASYRTEEV
jgi:hypothetical protein